MKNFTEEQVRAEARRIYGKPISIDMIDEAMREDTLEEAVQVIILDSTYWDEGPAGLLKNIGGRTCT